MVEPLRHRQTKGAETDMPDLPPPRHIPTLPTCVDPGVYWEMVGLGQQRPKPMAGPNDGFGSI
jgi:hypothetical protein